jgi:hypothetical protein
MEVLSLLAEARAAGLNVRAEGDTLIVRGPRSAEAIVAQLRDHKPEVLALLEAADPEVAWRVAALRPQISARGPIRWLAARTDTPATDAPRCCGSCGDPLPVGRRFRCVPCVRAIEIVLNAVQEEVE